MSLQPGQTLANRYRIVRLLGQGGMGAVYLAEDLNLLRKPVAIKENLDLSQAAQDQFRAEAGILARLSHPGLPQVTDHFVLPAGEQYLVMQYVDGEDLDQVLARRGPLPERDVLDWLAQVLEALQYMHAWVDPDTGRVTPVVHRDIKPANLKLTPAGRIVLVDFGIAKYQQPGGTKTGARAASPGFSPLEQYSGGTDVRSDVYSLGATLYCLLTGQVPPEAPDLASRRTTLAPPRQLVGSIGPATEAVILRAMQPAMPDRYQSVVELSAALMPGLWQTCPKCRGLNRAGARFCQTCGRPLSAPAQLPRPAAPVLPPTTPAHAPALAPGPAQRFGRRQIITAALVGLSVLMVCALGASVVSRRSASQTLQPGAVPTFATGLTLIPTVEPAPRPTATLMLIPTEPPATAPAQPATQGFTYTVVAGDTLRTIADRFGVTPEQIASANGLTDPNALVLGQRLLIPAAASAATAAPAANSTIYTVQRGDTMGGIAARFGTTLDELLRVNNISNPDRLVMGQKLIVPANAATPATSETTSRPRTYVMQGGDTLLSVARRFGMTVRQLQDANGIANPDRIYPGQTIIIP